MSLLDVDDLREQRQRFLTGALEGVPADDRAVGAAVKKAADFFQQTVLVLCCATGKMMMRCPAKELCTICLTRSARMARRTLVFSYMAFAASCSRRFVGGLNLIIGAPTRAAICVA